MKYSKDNPKVKIPTPIKPKKVNLENLILMMNDRQDKQEKSLDSFKDEAYKSFNGFADKLKDIFDELSNRNPPALQETIQEDNQLPSEGKVDSEGNFVDKNNVNWGKSRPRDEFAQQPQRQNGYTQTFSKSPDGSMLAKLGLSPDSAAAIANKAIDALMSQKNTQQNSIMQELMMRNFMEDLEQSKLMKHAFNNMLLKKGLISDDMFTASKETVETLTEPIKKMTEKMRHGSTNPTN